MIPDWSRSCGGMRSSDARRARRARLGLLLLVLAGCAGAAKTAGTPAGNASERDAASAPPAIHWAGESEGTREALELLAKSEADSCPACARDHRRSAFTLLEEQFPPGAIVRSDSLRGFTRAPASTNELIFTPHASVHPPLTFRFHTAEDHLVGISEANLTDEGLASLCRDAADGAVLRGAIEIVPFAYGDGPTFLYLASDRRVQIHCKILSMSND